MLHRLPIGRRAHDHADEWMRAAISSAVDFGHSRASFPLNFFWSSPFSASGKTLSEPEPDILRCFSTRGDLRATFPIVAQLPDKVERPGHNHGVLRSGPLKRILQRSFRLRNNREVRGVVRRNFC